MHHSFDRRVPKEDQLRVCSKDAVQDEHVYMVYKNETSPTS